MLLILLLLFESVLAVPTKRRGPVPKQAQLGQDDGFLSNPLSFTRNGTFQISIFEDLHFGESELNYTI